MNKAYLASWNAEGCLQCSSISRGVEISRLSCQEIHQITIIMPDSRYVGAALFNFCIKNYLKMSFHNVWNWPNMHRGCQWHNERLVTHITNYNNCDNNISLCRKGIVYHCYRYRYMPMKFHYFGRFNTFPTLTNSMIKIVISDVELAFHMASLNS